MLVKGLKRTTPQRGSYNKYTNHDEHCRTQAVVVETCKDWIDRRQADWINVFFQREGKPDEGVGLAIPKEIAGAFAYLILAAAQREAGQFSVCLPILVQPKAKVESIAT